MKKYIAAGYIGRGIIVVLDFQIKIIGLETFVIGKSTISLINHWSNSHAIKINL